MQIIRWKSTVAPEKGGADQLRRNNQGGDVEGGGDKGEGVLNVVMIRRWW